MAIEGILAVLQANMGELPKDIKVASAKLILIGMANHGNAEGQYIFPSVKRLSVYTGLGESTIRRYLAYFRSIGLLDVVKEAHGPYPTEYRMDVLRLRHKKHQWLIDRDLERAR